MDLPGRLREAAAGEQREPVGEAGKDREGRAEAEHVVEMRDDVVGVVQHRVDAGIGKHDAGGAADREHDDEADCPQHRHGEA